MIQLHHTKFNNKNIKGIQRINNRIKFIFNSSGKLNKEVEKIENEVKSLVLELPKAKSNIFKSKIEKMIIELEKEKEELKEKQIYIKSDIEELKNILKQRDKLFIEYKKKNPESFRHQIKKKELKENIQEITSFIRLEGTKIKIALSSVNSRGLVRLEFVSAPR